MAVMIFSHIESAGRLPVVDASADAVSAEACFEKTQMTTSMQKAASSEPYGDKYTR